MTARLEVEDSLTFCERREKDYQVKNEKEKYLYFSHFYKKGYCH